MEKGEKGGVEERGKGKEGVEDYKEGELGRCRIGGEVNEENMKARVTTHEYIN